MFDDVHPKLFFDLWFRS